MSSNDRILRLAMTDPLDAYEEGIRDGWRMALAWADAVSTPPEAGE